jgi:alkaline phosphatase D
VAITGDWDRRISRRTLLKTGGSLAAGLTLAGIASRPAAAQEYAGGYPFTLGVASGDPSPTSIVLWTRLAPDPLVDGGGLPAEPYEVRFELSKDEDFHSIQARGSTLALPEEAHSVRFEVDELGPRHEYFYRFKAGNEISPVGRTRTTPPGSSMVRSVTFAFISCQNFAHGYFTPLADVAAASDIEAVIHLGDYIYEGPANIVRTHAPLTTIMTLEDYRIRHSQYKTDPDLQAAHAAHPWLVTWDDHEFANNYADLDLDNPEMSLADAQKRRAAAYLAYWEHMPLARFRKPVEWNLQLYRRFTWGQQATFNVLDGRQYRSDQPRTCRPAERQSGYCPDSLAEGRTMLGAEQLDWLLQDLATTKARWNVLAQQTAFAPRNFSTISGGRSFDAGADNWEGYVAERQSILDWLVEQGTPNPVVLTGDTHQHWVRNIPRDYRDLTGEPVATEFLGSSITTGGDSTDAERIPRLEVFNNPHILLRNDVRGYVRCTVTPESWTSEYRIVDTVRQPQATASTLATFVVENGRPGAQLVRV